MTHLSTRAHRRALSHPHRIAIIEALQEGLDSTIEISIRCRLLPYQVRAHVIILRRAGIVQMKSIGKKYHKISLIEKS